MPIPENNLETLISLRNEVRKEVYLEWVSKDQENIRRLTERLAFLFSLLKFHPVICVSLVCKKRNDYHLIEGTSVGRRC